MKITNPWIGKQMPHAWRGMLELLRTGPQPREKLYKAAENALKKAGVGEIQEETMRKRLSDACSHGILMVTATRSGGKTGRVYELLGPGSPHWDLWTKEAAPIPPENVVRERVEMIKMPVEEFQAIGDRVDKLAQAVNKLLVWQSTARVELEWFTEKYLDPGGNHKARLEDYKRRKTA